MIEAPILLQIDGIYVDEEKMPFPFDEAGSIALGQQIAVDGQLVAITVRRRANAEKGQKDQPFELIDGRRRLEGMRGIGRADIAATVIQCKKDEVRRLSVAANLQHRLLTVIELAMLIGVMWQSAEIIAAGSARGKADATAAIIGRSTRTVFNYLKLYHTLVEPFPTLVHRLFRHEISNDYTALAQIASEPREEFRLDALTRVLSREDISRTSRPAEPKREYSDGFGYKWRMATVREQLDLVREVIEGTRLKTVPLFLAETIHNTASRKRPSQIVSDALKLLPDKGLGHALDVVRSLPEAHRQQVLEEILRPSQRAAS